MATTPRGTRILPTSIPLGCGRTSVISPIGSLREAIWRSPAAICATVSTVIVKRSINALERPFFSASTISRLFALSRSSRFLPSKSAKVRRTSFFCLEEALAMIKEAARAFLPMAAILSWAVWLTFVETIDYYFLFRESMRQTAFNSCQASPSLLLTKSPLLIRSTSLKR